MWRKGPAVRRRRSGEVEGMTMHSAIEVAAVKAQVQHIIRNLRATLDDLEAEIRKLPDPESDDDGEVDG
jgi:cell division protein FtsB